MKIKTQKHKIWYISYINEHLITISKSKIVENWNLNTIPLKNNLKAILISQIKNQAYRLKTYLNHKIIICLSELRKLRHHLYKLTKNWSNVLLIIKNYTKNRKYLINKMVRHKIKSFNRKSIRIVVEITKPVNQQATKEKDQKLTWRRSQIVQHLQITK